MSEPSSSALYENYVVIRFIDECIFHGNRNRICEEQMVTADI
jgi:hypothetical protein